MENYAFPQNFYTRKQLKEFEICVKTVNRIWNLEFLHIFLDIQLPGDTDEIGISLD